MLNSISNVKSIKTRFLITCLSCVVILLTILPICVAAPNTKDYYPILLFGEIQNKPPNIIWIFADDHAYQAIGAYGGRLQSSNLTPNIDRLAQEGITFDHAYVGNSICAPSRATLLTGKHSHLSGVRTNTDPFDHGQPQFQKLLQKANYQTALIGKIHLDGTPQGFDYWEVLPGQGRYYDPEFITADGTKTYIGHSTDIITDRALYWLQNKRKATLPFMLMVHYKASHRSWYPDMY